MVSENSEMETKGKCAVCNEIAKTRCSGCSKVFYCCVEHQRKDWKNHKISCHPFRIASDAKYGRYLIATKNIKAGEVVLKEAPLVTGPSQMTGPVCVGCLHGLEEKLSLECERCGWPVCRRECQDNINHQDECKLTVARGSKVSIQHFFVPHPTYQCLTPLRCLLLNESNQSKWNELIKLESHCEQRRGTDQWRNDREGVAKFIPRFFKCENKWSEDEILKITGILQVNGHEVPLADPPYVAVYNLASLLEHSCKPNLSKSFTKKGEISFWAPNPIKKDERLSICYTDALWGAFNRQNHLRQTKLFNCECVRCKDVTEFGSYFSGLKCTGFKKGSSCTGIILPQALDKMGLEWICNKCKHSTPFADINNILDHAAKDFEAMEKGNEEHCNKYIRHYSKWLHPNHYYLTDIKISLSQIIGGGSPDSIKNISDDKLLLKIKTCQDLLDLFDMICPAETRAIGTTRFELHTALAEFGRRGADQKNPNFRSALEDSMFSAAEAARLLEHEPSVLTEGKIGEQAKLNANSLKVMLGMSEVRL